MVHSESAAFELTRPECLVPAKKNGGLDLTCILAANALLKADLIDTPMSINYKPGGIGAVAYNYVVGVRNNDPQLLVAASSGSALNIAIKKFGRYDANAVRWLGALGADYGVIAVRDDAPWQSLDELIESLKKDQNSIIFGGGGSIGSQDWMKTALVVKAVGIDPKSIRYAAFEGGGEAATALLEGYIQVFPGDAAELHNLLKTKKVRVLALLAETRLPGIFAGVPTAKEQGISVNWTIWRGYYLGPKVSDDDYNWWVNTFRRLIKTDEFQQERKRNGLYSFEMIGQPFEEFVRNSVRQYRQVATDIGLLK
jgi:putative tricarboxylic transport membrane protein